jgi:hypothetical protein
LRISIKSPAPLSHAKVQYDELTGINRDTVSQNRELVSLTLKHLGTRMAVSTLEVHIRAFYDLMHLNVGSTLSKSRGCMVMVTVGLYGVYTGKSFVSKSSMF